MELRTLPSTPADSARGGSSRSALSSEQRLAAATTLPAAVSATASEYAARINKLLGWNRSVASLLFETEAAQLTVGVDATHDSSTVSAMKLPRAVELLSLRRPSAGKERGSVPPSMKLAQGDELIMRAVPHVLVQAAVLKCGKVVLAGNYAREQMGVKVKRERQALVAAAEDLQRRLRPYALALYAAANLAEQQALAASRIQGMRLGQLARRKTAPALDVQRNYRKAGRLRAKKLVARIRLDHAPVGADTSEAHVREWKTRAQLKQSMRFAKQAATARSHAESLNSCLAAAPEARRHRLPLSPLELLFHKDVELTTACAGDKGAPPTTAATLLLPRGLMITALTTANGKSVAARSVMAAKLQAGDQLTIKGPAHQIAGVAEVKNGKLLVLAPRARTARADLKRQRLSLLASAERLARRLQRLMRARLSRRQELRHNYAALILQLGWTTYCAKRGSAVLRSWTHRKGPHVPYPTPALHVAAHGAMHKRGRLDGRRPPERTTTTLPLVGPGVRAMSSTSLQSTPLATPLPTGAGGSSGSSSPRHAGEKPRGGLSDEAAALFAEAFPSHTANIAKGTPRACRVASPRSARKAHTASPAPSSRSSHNTMLKRVQKSPGLRHA